MPTPEKINISNIKTKTLVCFYTCCAKFEVIYTGTGKVINCEMMSHFFKHLVPQIIWG